MWMAASNKLKRSGVGGEARVSWFVPVYYVENGGVYR